MFEKLIFKVFFCVGRFIILLKFKFKARKQIFKIHTADWDPSLSDDFFNKLAAESVGKFWKLGKVVFKFEEFSPVLGYCGADIKGLCTEAALIALRKRYPQIYLSDKKLLVDSKSLQVSFFLEFTSPIF